MWESILLIVEIYIIIGMLYTVIQYSRRYYERIDYGDYEKYFSRDFCITLSMIETTIVWPKFVIVTIIFTIKWYIIKLILKRKVSRLKDKKLRKDIIKAFNKTK